MRKNKTYDNPKVRRYIISALRRVFGYTPEKREVLLNARRPYSGANKKAKWEYICEICSIYFLRKDIRVDHKRPVVPLKGFKDWDDYINRMFCGVKGLQALCRECHKKKTNEERVKRNKYKKTKGK